MDHSFSVDEVPTLQLPMQPDVDDDCGRVVACEDTPGHDAINRSSSEWSFERLLEEELMGSTTPPVDSSASVFHIEPVSAAVEVEPATMTMDGMADPVEYNAMLKRKLEEDLAAIAMWRASSAVHPETSQGSYAYNGGSRNLGWNKFRNDREHLRSYSKLPARSSSSPSDDDDLDGEVEIVGFRMPDSDKMKRRKESNRESARRSRTRKAARMKDLEDQVAHLRVENSALLTRLDGINQKYKASAIDNRILRADMETLRTKVKMAEDTINRLIGTTPSFNSMPFVGSPSHATPPADPSVPILNNNDITTNNYYVATSDARVSNSYMPRADPSPLQAEDVVNESSNTMTINGITASHCATDMELLQEMVSAMPSTSSGDGAAQWEAAPLGLDEIITDSDIEGHEDPLGNMEILG
ncbi:hypothetical protein PR202_gb12490 [Eleusine coracana subsp. coracana]|uniref:BZIP domain-containing protein n=1 Tax=Eleusine coracana subsp. coracana TaxID=191504 RepID=A0AAV5EQK0_ELECO|nr:hypothetical protein QOZ80_7BG0589470 [Eleusine coracana subsp. coracana]GJN24732.1 hypothetical protein PR202_gb12490 [Eleusine coracana subsp. coracana]